MERPGEGTELVALYEEQRSNGITLQRRVFEDAFGKEWEQIPAQKALEEMRKENPEKYKSTNTNNSSTLGGLVATPSTPYFRPYSTMPHELRDSVKLVINVSSGGIFRKTRRALEPLGLGAEYESLFDCPELITLPQMASRSKNAGKGEIPNEVAYYTRGCGNGAIIGTTNPDGIAEYFERKGIRARKAGKITSKQEISISSRCLDAKQKAGKHTIVHMYSDKPLG